MIYDGDIFEHGGARFRFRTEWDSYMGTPWEEHDGHGPVSEWTSRDKRPGERVLCSDRGSRRFYDFAEAVRIAKRDSWGFEGMDRFTMRPGEIAAQAVERDFRRLRDWCADRWQWIGVIVEMVDSEGEALRDHGASLWGIESDAGDYLETVARELADEILAGGRALAESLGREFADLGRFIPEARRDARALLAERRFARTAGGAAFPFTCRAVADRVRQLRAEISAARDRRADLAARRVTVDGIEWVRLHPDAFAAEAGL